MILRLVLRLVLLVAVAVASAVSAAPRRAQAYGFWDPPDDAASGLFDPRNVVRIDLSIPQASRDALSIDPYEYVDAGFTLTDHDATYGPWPVKLRLKGQIGSFRDLSGKAAFKLKFPSAANRVAGRKKLTLNNMVQDPSFVRETLAYDVFREMGVPAPRTGYAVVTVDGEPYGLYLNVETMDDVALARWYGEDRTQHLYEGSYGAWLDAGDPYGSHYEVDEGDEDDRADLAELVAAANVPGDAWRDAAGAVADLREMVRMWAVERYLGHWDGYSYGIVNNYYLHADTLGMFTMLPWGTDQTFGAPLGFDEVAGGALFMRCREDPVYLGIYADSLVATRRAVADLRLAARAETLFESLTDEIAADVRAGADVTGAAAAKDELVRFLADRPEALSDWLEKTPPAPQALVVVSAVRSVTLYWRPSEAAGAARVTGYRVHAHRRGGRTRTIDVPGESSFSATIDGLADGSSWEFRVSTVTSRGRSLRTPPVRAIVGVPWATHGVGAHRAAEDRSVVVTWARPVFTGVGRVRFDLDAQIGRSGPWRRIVRGDRTPDDGSGAHSIRLDRDAAPPGTIFRIRARNAAGPGPWTMIPTIQDA